MATKVMKEYYALQNLRPESVLFCSDHISSMLLYRKRIMLLYMKIHLWNN